METAAQPYSHIRPLGVFCKHLDPYSIPLPNFVFLTPQALWMLRVTFENILTEHTSCFLPL